jgi:hypothetical protein
MTSATALAAESNAIGPRDSTAAPVPPGLYRRARCREQRDADSSEHGTFSVSAATFSRPSSKASDPHERRSTSASGR